MALRHGRDRRMHVRNGDHGYGVVTKLLHWVTVAAVAGQFAVGWAMDVDDATDAAEDRVDAEEERLEEDAEGRGEAAEEQAEAEIDRREDALDARDEAASDLFSDVVSGSAFGEGLSLPELHVTLGLA